MASNKSRTTSAAEVNGVPTAGDAVSAAAGADISTGKLCGRLKAADGVAHRTKKPKKTPKAATPKTPEDAAKSGTLSALDAAAKVLQQAGQPMN
jgi:hypothetical protein